MIDQTGPLSPLAIVVPAYKGSYLRAALASLAAQTDQHFQLYVCDDASPDDLASIHRAVFPDPSAARRFVRFDTNLGGTSLVKQWNRCMAQTRGEPWLWLFSDDDLTDPQCVARFHHALAAAPADSPTRVFRYDTASVDASGAVFELHPPHPPSESAASFAYHRLTFQRRSFVSEYIFRREAFEANGGFVDFPFALGSDDASWITFTADAPIVTLPCALVYWRLSGENTSLLQGPAAAAKLFALADFSRWMEDRFRAATPLENPPPGASKIDMAALARQWFARITWSLSPAGGHLHVGDIATGLESRGLGSRQWWLVRLWYIFVCNQFKDIAERLKKAAKSFQSPPNLG